MDFKSDFCLDIKYLQLEDLPFALPPTTQVVVRHLLAPELLAMEVFTPQQGLIFCLL
jgi:hypothetical protein